MTDRNELINDIAELKAKRDRLLAQMKEAEQWESVAWDSYYAVADHVKALEKKQEIGRNYWESSQRAISHQFDFVADQANKVKKVLAKKRYDLLDEEIDKLMNEVRELADVLEFPIIRWVPRLNVNKAIGIKKRKRRSRFRKRRIWIWSCNIKTFFN